MEEEIGKEPDSVRRGEGRNGESTIKTSGLK